MVEALALRESSVWCETAKAHQTSHTCSLRSNPVIHHIDAARSSATTLHRHCCHCSHAAIRSAAQPLAPSHGAAACSKRQRSDGKTRRWRPEPGLARRRRRGISSSAALARGVAGEAAPAAIACWRVAGASALNLATRRARRGVAAASTGAMRLWQLAPVCSSRRISCFFSRSAAAGRRCCDPQSWSASARSGSARIDYAGREVPDAFWLGAPAQWPERRSWPATRPEPRRPVTRSPRRRACCGPHTFWRAATRAHESARRRGRPAYASPRRASPRPPLSRGATRCGDSADKPRCSSLDSLLYHRWSATRVSLTWSNI